MAEQSTLIASLGEALMPWADLYGDSIVLQAAVMLAHFGGILVAGGLALASDRATFRVLRRTPEVRTEHLSELGAVHTPILLALALTSVSGVALLLADVEALIVSWTFWAKMLAFGLLLLNGLALRRAELGLEATPTDPSGWASLRLAARRSAALWGLLLLMGTLLPLIG